MAKIAKVLSIAGTDPSGGAGIHADIKAISATGSYAAAVITALVAQNTQAVQEIYPISPAFVRQQLFSVFSDLNIHAIKIGMLYDSSIMEIILDELTFLDPIPWVVLDPVILAKGGALLLDLASIDFLKNHLFGFVDLITPNIPEAEYLLKRSISSLADMEKGARTLGQTYKLNVLLKGGHLNHEESIDLLYEKETDTCSVFKAWRRETKNTHGTGCSLSSAIASYLAQAHPMKEAITLAKNYVTEAIGAADSLDVGRGRGPIDHFYFLANRIS